MDNDNLSYGSLILALVGIAVGMAIPLMIAGDKAGAALPYVLVGAAIGVIIGGAALYAAQPAVGLPVVAVALLVALVVIRSLGNGWGLALPPYILASFAGTVFGSQLRHIVDARERSTRNLTRRS